MKSKDSSHVTTFMQPCVIYCTAAFHNYRPSIPAHLFGNWKSTPKDLSGDRRKRFKEGALQKGHNHRYLLRASSIQCLIPCIC